MKKYPVCIHCGLAHDDIRKAKVCCLDKRLDLIRLELATMEANINFFKVLVYIIAFATIMLTGIILLWWINW